ncbi:metalloproteinase inhibitor 2-like [Mytilus californianus]|uniref:metalloproteinase inhibitor 2-like n=1 Tax=Mytilus californianus TaxID=6549 RepID=UPI0022452AF3|nr:metalloproteinase inhibitor 2-like [Mytilus californianus]
MIKKVIQLIIALTWMTTSVHSCSCGGQHPQDAFCSADYVFYGKVIKYDLIPGPPDDFANNFATWNYTFKIIFKMKGITERVGQDIAVDTAGNEGICGVRFTVGKSYIVMGRTRSDGMKETDSCRFISQLNSLSPYQSFYLFTRGSYSYNRNCRRRCKIGPKSKGCRYQQENADFTTTKCLANKALCQRERRRCRWVNNETCNPIYVITRTIQIQSVRDNP